jgi:hypothetical protein
LFDQGLVQILQASVTGLQPRSHYVLALSGSPDGSGPLEPLSAFMTNPTGSAIVNATGRIRQLVRDPAPEKKRYLVIAPGLPEALGTPVQFEVGLAK